MMNKYLKYFIATLSFVLAGFIFYTTYTITELQDTMRDFEAGNMGESATFNFHGMLISIIGVILVILFVYIGFRCINSAKKS